jgi:uncharacterized membrane protein
MKIEQQVLINLPVEDIFAYLSELENLVEWSGTVISVRRILPGTVKVGAAMRITFRFLGRWLENIYEVVEWQANSLITLKSTSGVVPCVFSCLLEATNAGGTQVQLEARINIRIKGGFMDLAESVLAGAARRQAEHDLLTLKDLLETSVKVY